MLDGDHALLSEAIANHKPDVLISIRCGGCIRNKRMTRKEMASVFAAIDAIAETGPAVIIVHHTGKPGLDGHSRSQHSPRGTSDFEGWPNTLFWLEVTGDRRDRTFLVQSIMRDGEDVTFYFQVVSEGPSLALNPATKPATKLAVAEVVITRMLADGEEHHQPTVKRQVAEEIRASQPTVNKVLSALKENGLIEVSREEKEGKTRAQWIRWIGLP